MKRLSSKNGLVLAGWCSGPIDRNDILNVFENSSVQVYQQTSKSIHSFFVWPDEFGKAMEIINRIKAHNRQMKKDVL